MKKVIAILIVCLFACKDKEKEVGNGLEKSEADWKILFDGSSLDNWRGYLSDSIYPEWTIEDRILAFTPSEKGGKNIITKEKYTNFILSLEWKISEGGNSGIFWSVYEDEAYPEAITQA